MKIYAVLFLCCLAFPVGAAAAESSVFLEELTWEEVKAAIDSGTDTVIITIGATEQHGPQIALASDSITGDYLAPEIARRVGRTLVAPNIRVGVSPHHMYFPGTISVRSEVITQLVIEYVHSLVWHGFRHIAILPTHGGNFSTSAEIGRRVALLYPYVNIMAFANADAYINTLTSTSKRLGVPLDVAGSHAGMSETSMALAARPDLVRMNRASEGFMGDAYGAGDKMNHEGTPGVSSIGVLGDPRAASAEAGREYLADLATLLADYVQTSRAQWQPAPPQDLPDGSLAEPKGELAEGIRLRRAGNLIAAQSFFEDRLKREPGLAEARLELARTSVLMGNFADAAELVTPLLNSENMTTRAQANDELAYVSMYQGRFQDALGHKATAAELLRESGASAEDQARRLLQMGYIRSEIAQYDGAREAFAEAVALMPGVGAFNLDIRHLAALVDFKQGRLHTADFTRRAIGDAVFEPGLEAQIRRFYQLDSELQMALGHPADALSSLALAIRVYDHPLYREAQARAFLMLDQLDDAEETLLRLINLTDARLDIPIMYVRAHYQLGGIYERQGRLGDAVKMYSRFLGFWGDVSVPLTDVENAREALSRLAAAE